MTKYINMNVEHIVSEKKIMYEEILLIYCSFRIELLDSVHCECTCRMFKVPYVMLNIYLVVMFPEFKQCNSNSKSYWVYMYIEFIPYDLMLAVWLPERTQIVINVFFPPKWLWIFRGHIYEPAQLVLVVVFYELLICSLIYPK